MNPKPILPGMKVCLNPERLIYNIIKNEVGETTGYIVEYPSLNNKQIAEIIKNNNNQELFVHVIFKGNKKIYYIKIKNIIPIDNIDYANIKIYHLTDNKFYVVINDEKNDVLDEKIIANRFSILSIKNYNNEWRNKIFKAIET